MSAALVNRVHVDPTNPGQFFGCCGLLELADRLWGGAEGWYSSDHAFFCVAPLKGDPLASLVGLLQAVTEAGLEGQLSPTLRVERETIETKRRQLKKERKQLEPHEEARRKELGTLLREGAILIGNPFNLRLDWWQWDSPDSPKTWAGSQQVLRIASAALRASARAFATGDPFDYGCVMRDEPEEATEDGGENGKKVEPFYFDARRGMSALPLDIGFAPDSLERMESLAYPAVEFLCLVGLQRFRPVPAGIARVFDYYTWTRPLPASIAPVASCGLLAGVAGEGFRFENAFRTDQKKHKAFTGATPIYRSNHGQSAGTL